MGGDAALQQLLLRALWPDKAEILSLLPPLVLGSAAATRIIPTHNASPPKVPCNFRSPQRVSSSVHCSAFHTARRPAISAPLTG